MSEKNVNSAVYRILDANINRLREALRAVEEYYRFVSIRKRMAVLFKTMRHSVLEIETLLGAGNLIAARDTATDPLADGTRPEELNRASVEDVLKANLKRAQEACRIIEEYSKVCGGADASDKAKKLRFRLYAAEKQFMETESDG